MFRMIPRRPRVGFSPRLRKLAFLAVVLSALTVGTQAFAVGGADWVTIGHDPANSRNQPSEQDISPSTVAALAQKWVATTTGDVSGTPAVAGGAVYFGDFGGTLWKVDADTGATIWSRKVTSYTGIANDLARTSPSLDGNVLIVGSLVRPVMLGINATTGDLIWKTQVNPDTQAAGHGIMTGSPILVGDTVITGVSATGAGGANATFRADIVALNALTGNIIWQTFSVPDNHGLPTGYAGATMFSPPAVDVADGLVYGTFGQIYREPASVAACNAADPNGFSEHCEQPGSYLSSIVAFNLQTGAPVWSYRVVGDLPWQRACGSQPPAVTWCAAEGNNPEHGGDAWDLGGSGANVFQIGNRTVVGVGEKSGVYVVLDAKTGDFIWNTLVGPGGDQGGFEWGTAYDGNRIYVSVTNQHHIPYTLTENGVLTNTTVTGGSWAALDPATGKIIWQVADPQIENVPGFTGVGVWDLAPVSSANGVVFAASMAKSGNQMYALDGATGAILWKFAAGSSVNAGPAIVDGSVYWGTGYSRSGVEGTGNTKLYGLSLRPAGNVECVNQVLTGLVQGNLRVPKGAWCDLTNNVIVTGNLQLNGSTGVRIVGATIQGNLDADHVSGTADPSSPGLNVICGTTVNGNLQVHNSGPDAHWNIGGGAGCGNTVGGNLAFHGNDSTGNTISGNTVGGNLQCRDNAGATGSGNLVHGNIQGTCTGTKT